MGTEWQVIWGQLQTHKYVILMLMAAAITAAVLVLRGDDRIYMALGGAVAMIPAAYLDGRYYRLYHRLTIGGLLLGILCSAALEILMPGNQLARACEGMACLGGLFLALYIATGQLGFGDVCYGAALGTFLGWQCSLVAFVLIFALGLAAACREYLYYFRHGSWRRRMLPLGPFMACGAYISLLWGQELIRWYTGVG